MSTSQGAHVSFRRVAICDSIVVKACTDMQACAKRKAHRTPARKRKPIKTQSVSRRPSSGVTIAYLSVGTLASCMIRPTADYSPALPSTLPQPGRRQERFSLAAPPRAGYSRFKGDTDGRLRPARTPVGVSWAGAAATTPRPLARQGDASVQWEVFMAWVAILAAFAALIMTVMGLAVVVVVWLAHRRRDGEPEAWYNKSAPAAEPEGDYSAAAPGPRYHLVILNDDTHSFLYVASMLQHVFDISPPKAHALTRVIDGQGRAVVFTGSLEEVNKKRIKVAGFGLDWLSRKAAGPLGVVIEKAG
jgi:ATP-dependent Clp protease adaptor protein ClpS